MFQAWLEDTRSAQIESTEPFAMVASYSELHKC
jgi:hypothetical protein